MMTIRHSSLAAAAAAMALAPVTVAAAQENDEWVRVPPSSRWIADFAEDSCALRRTFEDGERRFLLELRQFQPQTGMQIIVASDMDRKKFRGVRLGFVPDTQIQEHQRAMAIDIDGYGEGVLDHITPYTEDLRKLAEELRDAQSVSHVWTDEQRNARESEIDGIAIQLAYSDDIVLETGPMHDPFKIMRTCMDDLLGHWGIDAEAHRSLLRKVRPLNQERWVRPIIQNYPHEMLRNGEQAVVHVRLNVSAEGKPTDCTIQLPMSNPVFDRTSCAKLMKYAEFEPAIDSNGDPIDSVWITNVIYAMN
ncbi:TonB family protein [Aurantiacibacter rhizosphaerae]|uniref:TonB family protein n=1 Tax=Aurantiacibacter rhizosphaerae TaxID=2691582 RepID=A0A844XI16_9SPHN|nr:TonB family protein [Aurantiacibacter rhizosphaerae]MWV29369.1 TonB family protein [Aurantiacibacter rhizosphaerae]